jgi:PAS domain S-box-containing protein
MVGSSGSEALARTAAAAKSVLFARAVGLLTMVSGALILLGWYFDQPLLRDVLPNTVLIKPNTAAGLMIAGLGLLAFAGQSSRGVSRFLGLVLFLGGGATLSQDIFGWDLHIDQSIFRGPENLAYTSSPGRMSPVSALSFVLLGGAFILARRGWVWSLLADIMLAAVLVQTLLVLIGYIYGVPALYYRFPLTPISVYVAVFFNLLAIATLAAMPDRGIAAAVLDRSLGGQMIRALLPWVVLIPIALGWLQHRGVLAGHYDNAVSIALFAASAIVLQIAIVWVTASVLRRSDHDRQRALTQLDGEREWLKTTLASIADGVIVTDANGMVQMMNGVAEELTGRSREEATGSPIWEVFRTINETTREPVDSSGLVALRERSIVKNTVHLLVKPDAAEVPVEHSGAPIMGAGKLVVGAVLIFRDVTERRRTEERQSLLVRELNHRVRNVLMIVHSLVQASARHASGTEAGGMAEVLAERLRSLSRAHELLLDTQWSGASLRAMIERELEPFQGESSDAIAIDGPDVLLPPQSTSILAMALHELTTNAVKHGALLQPAGRLAVSWRVRGAKLILKWAETGVKISAGVKRKPGFGTQLIEQGIKKNLGGDTRVAFGDDGLTVTITCSLERKATEEPPLATVAAFGG